MLLSAVPVTVGCVKWLGGRRAARLLVALSIFAYGIETIALRTGFPYGQFSYSGTLGYALFNITPWTVPLGWVPLIIASWTCASCVGRTVGSRVLLTTGILVVVDLILDPAAVSLGFWRYAHPGFWGGVPYTNFLGWMVSGLIGCYLLNFVVHGAREPDHVARRWLLAGFLPAFATAVLWISTR